MLLYYPNNKYWKSTLLNHNHPYENDQERFNLFKLIETLSKGHIVDVNYLYCDNVYNQAYMIHPLVMVTHAEQSYQRRLIVWDGHNFFV